MDEPSRVGGPLIRPLSYYLQSPSPPQVQPAAEFASRGRFIQTPMPTYNCHNSTEKLLLEADLLFNELQSSSSSPTTLHVPAPSATLRLPKTSALPNAAAPEPAAKTKTKARKPEATLTSTVTATTKRQRAEQGAEDERYAKRVEVSERDEQASNERRPSAKPSRGSDEKTTQERKNQVAAKNTRRKGKKKEKAAKKGKRARESADEEEEGGGRRKRMEEEEEEEPKRRRTRRTAANTAGQSMSAYGRPGKGRKGPRQTGESVCAEHFRAKCATCTKRLPVLVKYGVTFVMLDYGRHFVCLHPLRDTGEPCGVTFETQHELIEHRLAHEASERPGGLVHQDVLDRRLEVSAVVVQLLMNDLDGSKKRLESTARITALIDRECARLGYDKKCKPSTAVVLQRYRWARYRHRKFDGEELTNETMRLRRRLQLEVMEKLMSEDIPMADLEQDWVVARIAHLWDQWKDQRRGTILNKSMIVATLYNWVRRTYSKWVPPLFPPRIDKRSLAKKEEEKKEMNKRNKEMGKEEEDAEVHTQSNDSYNDNDDEGSEDTAVNDDPSNNYDEDTEDEELPTGMEVNEAEEEEEEEKKHNESAASGRNRGGNAGGREAAVTAAAAASRSAPPSAVGEVKTTNAREGLTGRELVLARRRRVMETLDLLLASQVDE